jgi:ferritin-like metal-binding protein YciE
MPFKNPKEVFVLLLSDVRQGTERMFKFFNEIIPLVQDTTIKEALEARVFVSGNMIATLDQCFKLIGEQPVKLTGRLQETFIENFREELSEIQSPVAKHLFILAKLSHLVHLRIGELTALTAAADMTGNFAVGLLLESVLADQLVFTERTKRIIRNLVETKVAERKSVAAA